MSEAAPRSVEAVSGRGGSSAQAPVGVYAWVSI